MTDRGPRASSWTLPDAGGVRAGLGRELWRRVLHNAPVLASVLLFALLGWLGHELFGIPDAFSIWIPLPKLASETVVYLAVAAVFIAGNMVLGEGRSLRENANWAAFARRLIRPRDAVGYLIVIYAIGILMRVFISFKEAIPIIHPFSWDGAFMEWDRLLHVGHHPYELLQPLLGHPVVTFAIDQVYALWISVMTWTVMWQAWHGSRTTKTRSQFLLAYVCCWIFIGTGLAILLSSAGPVYFGQVTGGADPFVPLLQYLSAVDAQFPLRAVEYHELLWRAYESPETVGLGISAMPSMHISIAVLMALLGFAIRPWIGWAYTTFAFLIFLGSIHLAWHYAIDAYVAAPATVLVWWLCGKAVDWWQSRPFVPELGR